ncbi:MAG: TolC family protein [Ignavibacteriaceae bacterium]
MKKIIFLLLVVYLSTPKIYSISSTPSDSLLQEATLQNCVQYALIHQPLIKQSRLNEEITGYQIRSKLADWFPQLNFTYNFQHNYLLPTSIFQGNPIKLGVNNTSSGQFSLSQTIFDRDVLLAASTAGEVRNQAKQISVNNKINVIVTVSKAFYAVLFSQQQDRLLDEDIVRLKQSYEDAYNQYKGGVVDKTDYEQAEIALNNAEAEKKQNEELLQANYANLKYQMGYPADGDLSLSYNITAMENEVSIDTSLTLNYDKRIEYKLLRTQYRLDEANLKYNEWSFLPSLSAFAEYNFNYQNNNLPNLYNQNYPNSYVGLQLSFPILQGGKRIQEIGQAKLELERSGLDIVSLKNSINSEYVQAMTNYKSNLNNYNVMKKNLELAQDVYNTIELQYKSGIKTYLDVITSESNLRTTEVNLINALYQTLSSKLDVQKALGTIQY